MRAYVSPTFNQQKILKRACRQHGIKRWPYRKVKSLYKKKETLEQTAKSVYEQYAKLKEQIDELEKERNSILLEETGWTTLEDEDDQSAKQVQPIEKINNTPQPSLAVQPYLPRIEEEQNFQLTLPPLSFLLSSSTTSHPLFRNYVPPNNEANKIESLMNYVHDLMIAITGNDGELIWYSDKMNKIPDLFNMSIIGKRLYDCCNLNQHNYKICQNIFRCQTNSIDMQVRMIFRNIALLMNIRGMRLANHGYIWSYEIENECIINTRDVTDITRISCS